MQTGEPAAAEKFEMPPGIDFYAGSQLYFGAAPACPGFLLCLILIPFPALYFFLIHMLPPVFSSFAGLQTFIHRHSLPAPIFHTL